MTEDFMGASDGPIGSPFEEAAFYRSTPPNRDQPDRAPASVPPSRVSRRVLSSGRGPREVTLADVPELYSGLPAQDRPRSENVIRIRSDEEIVNRGLGFNRPGLEFERFWRAVYVDHGLAHRYIGGNIGGFGAADTAAAHRSFEDPFVFLLHSNVDRLWASWQLNNRGFNLWEEPAWRVEPAWAYGQLVDDLVEEAEGVVPLSGESQADYDRRYEAELARQGREAGLEIKSTMMPWNGRTTGRITIAPWSRMDATRDIRPTDRAVLRPPRYDRYVIGDELCATWTTLQLGRRLSTHDVVRLQVELDAVALADVEFVLRTGPEVSWWKAIRLPNGGMIETTSASGRASSLHPITELTGGQLIFHKAQGLSQAKRIVFRVADPGWIRGGSRLTFYWEDD